VTGATGPTGIKGVTGVTGVTGATGVASSLPVGSYLMQAVAYATVETTVGGQWLQCNGVAVSRTTYASLFTVLNALGLPFGAGNGTTTFNLPDLRGRIAIAEGTHADVDVMGDSDGQLIAARTPKHNHTVNDPGHTHAQQHLMDGNQPGGGIAAGGPTGTGALTTSSTTGLTVGPQTSAPTDSPAYLVVGSWFIRY
jgi:microcystin-dependent protein